MKFIVDVWFVSEEDNLPISKEYELSEEISTEDLNDRILDLIFLDEDFKEKENITFKVRDSLH